jgi:hypothetical protein
LFYFHLYFHKHRQSKNLPRRQARRQEQQSNPLPLTPKFSCEKTERESELEEFLLDYTEEFPKVKEIKFELGLLQKELDKITAVNASDSAN